MVPEQQEDWERIHCRVLHAQQDIGPKHERVGMNWLLQLDSHPWYFNNGQVDTTRGQEY